jgi:hypothetical protein
VQDLKHPARFEKKLRELLELHNFALAGYLHATPLEFQPIYGHAMQVAEQLKPMMADVGYLLYTANRQGANILFEGAQGTLLDIDHGTYPYVTSSNCVAGNAAAGAGVGPDQLHYILGITKAYTTRVGSGPFPTELPMVEPGSVGHHLSTIGQERGTVTGRARRCGWLDAAALKRSIIINGISGLWHHEARRARRPARDQGLRGLRARRQAHRHPAARCRRHRGPAARSTTGFPGWTETTAGITQWDACRSTRGATSSACRSSSARRSTWCPPARTASTRSCCAIRTRPERRFDAHRRRQAPVCLLGRVPPADRASGAEDRRVGLGVRPDPVPRARRHAARRHPVARVRQAARDHVDQLVPRRGRHHPGPARHGEVHHDAQGRARGRVLLVDDLADSGITLRAVVDACAACRRSASCARR